MNVEIKNGIATVHTVYAIDDVNNGIEEAFINKQDAIKYIEKLYDNDIQYMKSYTDRDGIVHTVAEQIYTDMKQLYEEGYITDAYYIQEIALR